MSLCSLSQQPPVIYVMSNAIDSSGKSNPSRICHLRTVPLCHVADKRADLGKLIRGKSVDLGKLLYTPTSLKNFDHVYTY